MASRFIETHCHLNDPKSFPDLITTIKESKDAGVDRLVVIGVDPASSKRAIELAETFEGVYATIGWHPNYCADYGQGSCDQIRALAGHPKVVAVGEIGLDYHWDYAPREKQFTALFEQLDLAEELDLPVVFHSREAYSDLLDILEKRPIRPYLLHCFGGDMEDAKRALKLGCVFGVDGPVTYPKAEPLRETLRHIGLSNLVLETDSPYLTPHPHRGKPNRPALIPLIAQGLATALATTIHEVAEATTENAERFYRLA